LTKIGEYYLSSNRRRFFVLDLKQHLLNYYEDETLVNFVGKIDLKKLLSVNKIDGYYFELVFHSRTYLMQAESEFEVDRWVTNLTNLYELYSDVGELELSHPIGFSLYQSKAEYISHYLTDECGVSKPNFVKMVQQGYELFLKFPIPINFNMTQNDLVSFIWFLYAHVASYNELFTSGLIRVDDFDEFIFNFFRSYHKCYQRRSSHFPEKMDLIGCQYGIDVDVLNDSFLLPCKKHAILFFKLGDGTTAIKLEKAGCPPIWETEHMTKNDVINYMSHAVEYVNTRVEKHVGVFRKEHIPKIYLERFKDILLYLLGSDHEHFNYYYTQGALFGISTMISIVQTIVSGPSQTNLDISCFRSAIFISPKKEITYDIIGKSYQSYEFINEILLLDKSRGYCGERKGMEVCLPYPRCIEIITESS